MLYVDEFATDEEINQQLKNEFEIDFNSQLKRAIERKPIITDNFSTILTRASRKLRNRGRYIEESEYWFLLEVSDYRERYLKRMNNNLLERCLMLGIQPRILTQHEEKEENKYETGNSTKYWKQNLSNND